MSPLRQVSAPTPSSSLRFADEASSVGENYNHQNSRFADEASSVGEDYNHQNSVRFCFNINQRTFSTESDGSAGPRSLDDRPLTAIDAECDVEGKSSGQDNPK